MSLKELLIVIAVVCTLYFLWKCLNCEGLSSAPSAAQREIMTNQMLNNKKLFNTSLDSTKQILPWIDAVVYEDARSLISLDKFNKKNINNILS